MDKVATCRQESSRNTTLPWGACHERSPPNSPDTAAPVILSTRETCRARQKQFVVTAFMRSPTGFRYAAPMNRGTTNGLGECSLIPRRNSVVTKYLLPCTCGKNITVASRQAGEEIL